MCFRYNRPMLQKTALLALLMAMLLIAPARAKTVEDKKSAVLIDLPEGEGWKIEEANSRTTAVCDEGVSIVVMRFDKQLPDVVIKRLADSIFPLFTDAKAGEDGVEKITVHGMQADKVTGYGKKDEKTVKFSAVLFSKDSTSTVAVIAFGSETPFKRHLRDIDAAFDSIRPRE
jgi:hypothetical protein